MIARSSTLALALALLLVHAPAFAQTVGAEALYGSWDADFQSMLQAQDMSEEERALASAMLGSAQMRLTFDPDGTMLMTGQMMGQQQSERGTWQFVSARDSTLTIAATTTKVGEAPETQVFRVTFHSPDRVEMNDEGGDAIPFNRAAIGPSAAQVAQAARPAAIPSAIGLLLLQAWGDDCSVDDLARSTAEAVDLNADGRTDYVVEDACSAGANDSDHLVFVDVGGTYRQVLNHNGETLGLHDATTNGYRELVGGYCDGWADCETSYYRWNGAAYERYRAIRDQQVE